MLEAQSLIPWWLVSPIQRGSFKIVKPVLRGHLWYKEKLAL